eukprot:sb/3474391/
MLTVASLVVITGVLAWFPSIIANVGNITMGYEISQMFTVTLFFLNSVSDPVIYILGYPSVKNYIRTMFKRRVNLKYSVSNALPTTRSNSAKSHSAIVAPRLRNSVRIDRSELENKVNEETLGNGSTEEAGTTENQLLD